MEKQETSADIIADMRTKAECAKPYDDGIVMMLTDYADRLEAAWKREKTAIEADALAAGGMVEASRATTEKSSVVGDRAKMREAVAKCVNLITEFGNAEIVKTPLDVIVDIEAILKAALAEPVRNCEVGTVEEQARRYLKYCVKQDCEKACPFRDCKNSYECAFGWARMPYDEGGAR